MAAATGPGGAEDDLMRAIVLCDEELALEIAQRTGGTGRTERETGYTALHHACEYGMEKLAALLVDSGAPLSARTRDLILQGAVVQPGGQTPLHLAVRSGEAAVVDLLLARGADPSACDANGTSPAVAAALLRREALAERLASAAGEALPSSEALESLRVAAKVADKARAAQHLEVPDHLRQVYTIDGVWSVEECQRVLVAVQAAQAAAGGWTEERHAAYATTDLPCKAVPEVDAWVQSSLASKVFPLLARRHGWLPVGQEGRSGREGGDGARLAFRDLFFVKYSAEPGRQAGLALHRDGSVISFNVLLNGPDNFVGGGTYIEADDRVYHIGQGDCFVHSGKMRHGGHPVTHGERYVLVAFVDVLEEEAP